MLTLVSHIVRTSAQRDRTKIDGAMVDAIDDLFRPHELTIYRVFPGAKRTMIFSCAGIGCAGHFIRNAYLPETAYCDVIDRDPVLVRCQDERAAVIESLPEGFSRLVFPIAPLGRLLYLIDIVVSERLTPELRTVLMGLIEYFSNHVALLDYAETDTLTGLPNRKTFDKHLFEVLGQAAVDDDREPSAETALRRRKGSHDGRYWLAVCDIDHFKAVNDQHGHLIGDEVLVTFAHLMRDAFRYHDQLFRFGGEEFVVVIQPTSGEAVHRAFERFRTLVEKHLFGRVGRISVSIGYCQLVPNDTPSDVIDRADEALYYVKQHGRNDVACYEELVDADLLAAKTSHIGEIELF